MVHRKHELEKLEELEGPQAALARNPSIYGTEVLRDFGLEEVASPLEKEMRPESKPAAEATPDR